MSGLSKAFLTAAAVISLNITRKIAACRALAGSSSSFQVPADGFAFAVGIGREVDGVNALGGLLEFGDQLLFAFDDFIAGCEVVIDVDRQILLRKVFDVPEGSLDDVLAAEIFSDSFRLRRGFNDDERFCHTRFFLTYL